jgi:hypothetical protein
VFKLYLFVVNGVCKCQITITMLQINSKFESPKLEMCGTFGFGVLGLFGI